jgi:hypothetical protein
LTSSADAKAELQNLGRKGRLPWCEPSLRGALGYISAGGVILVPVAHCLLRGLLRSLFILALTTPLSEVGQNHPVVFNTTQRQAVRVRADNSLLLSTNEWECSTAQ